MLVDSCRESVVDGEASCLDSDVRYSRRVREETRNAKTTITTLAYQIGLSVPKVAHPIKWLSVIQLAYQSSGLLTFYHIHPHSGSSKLTTNWKVWNRTAIPSSTQRALPFRTKVRAREPGAFLMLHKILRQLPSKCTFLLTLD